MAATHSPWRQLKAPPIKAREDARQFVLFDAAQIDGFGSRISGLSFLTNMASLYPPPLAPDRFNATPHLAEVTDTSGFGLLARLLDRAEASHGAITWLVSPLTLNELLARLRLRLDARLPGDFDCVNRFYDGRVLPHLHACMNEGQRAAFFACAEQWWFVSPAHEWQMLPCQFGETDSYEAPLRLDEKQEATMIDACYPYAVIEHFERSDPELLDPVPPNARYAHFDNALQTAKRFGIDGGEDAMLFCALTLTRGASFHEQSPWPDNLRAVRAGNMTLQQAVKALHD